MLIFVIWENLAAICYFRGWEYYWTKREKKSNVLEDRGTTRRISLVVSELPWRRIKYLSLVHAKLPLVLELIWLCFLWSTSTIALQLEVKRRWWAPAHFLGITALSGKVPKEGFVQDAQAGARGKCKSQLRKHKWMYAHHCFSFLKANANLSPCWVFSVSPLRNSVI